MKKTRVILDERDLIARDHSARIARARKLKKLLAAAPIKPTGPAASGVERVTKRKLFDVQFKRKLASS